MRTRTSIAAGILLFACSASQAEVVQEFAIGPWDGRIFADDETKKFSFCQGSAHYRNGTWLDVFVNRSFNWGLGFRNPEWSIGQQQFVMRYRFGGGAWQSVDAKKLSATEFFAFLPTGEGTTNGFQASRRMQANFLGMDYAFDLDGTRKLLDGLAQCVSVRLDMEKNAVADNQAVSQPPAQQPPQPSQVRESSGTGFLISSEGHILTNAHVVEGCGKIQTTLAADLPRDAALLRVDKNNDLAVIKAGPVGTGNVAHLQGRTLRAGESIAVYGFPLSGVLSASGNIVGGNITSLAGLNDDVRHFQISAPIQPGNSGGPLLNMQGEVAGVIVSKLNELNVADQIGTLPQNVNFAIKSSVAINFLEAHGIPFEYAPGSPAPPKDLSSVTEAAKRFTVHVRCTMQ